MDKIAELSGNRDFRLVVNGRKEYILRLENNKEVDKLMARAMQVGGQTLDVSRFDTAPPQTYYVRWQDLNLEEREIAVLIAQQLPEGSRVYDVRRNRTTTKNGTSASLESIYFKAVLRGETPTRFVVNTRYGQEEAVATDSCRCCYQRGHRAKNCPVLYGTPEPPPMLPRENGGAVAESGGDWNEAEGRGTNEEGAWSTVSGSPNRMRTATRRPRRMRASRDTTFHHHRTPRRWRGRHPR